MEKYFNTAGACDPQRHYMVDIRGRLQEIKKLIDAGEYFTINRARQYGKTTTLMELAEYLKEEYIVVFMDFQMIGNAKFATEYAFSTAFAKNLLRVVQNRRNAVCGLDASVLSALLRESRENETFALDDLFPYLSDLCGTAQKPVVLLIDEVDSATNNQVFLDFLGQLRAYYLARRSMPTFQSVILAGVYDVKNIRRKIRPDEAHRFNSPWNIAADFRVDMSFSKAGIRDMLKDYEADHHTGMDVSEMAGLLRDYTSGYPFLVSRLCKMLDEEIAEREGFVSKAEAWTRAGFLEAVKLLLMEKNTLFESLLGKIQGYPQLKETLYAILFGGEKVVYSPFDPDMDLAVMFGLVRADQGSVCISNRIFETLLYDYFLTAGDVQNMEISRCASRSKRQFIKNGRLDMQLVLQKFVEHFDSIYGDKREPFDEEEGRRRFLLYLRPIINGTGNYYIEAQTRNARRMDVVVDYKGEQFIIELKIYRGDAYSKRGEEQLSDYLDYFGLKRGYMLSYNFNRNKEIGIKEIHIGERTLIEAVV